MARVVDVNLLRNAIVIEKKIAGAEAVNYASAAFFNQRWNQHFGS